MTNNLNELINRYSARNVSSWEDWFLKSQFDDVTTRAQKCSWKDQLSKLDLLLVNNQRTVVTADSAKLREALGQRQPGFRVDGEEGGDDTVDIGVNK